MLEAHFLALAKTGLTKEQKAISGVNSASTPSKDARNSFRVSEPQQRVFHSHGWARRPMRNSQLDYWRAVGGSDENEFPFMEPETNITFATAEPEKVKFPHSS